MRVRLTFYKRAGARDGPASRSHEVPAIVAGGSGSKREERWLNGNVLECLSFGCAPLCHPRVTTLWRAISGFLPSLIAHAVAQSQRRIHMRAFPSHRSALEMRFNRELVGALNHPIPLRVRRLRAAPAAPRYRRLSHGWRIGTRTDGPASPTTGGILHQGEPFVCLPRMLANVFSLRQTIG